MDLVPKQGGGFVWKQENGFNLETGKWIQFVKKENGFSLEVGRWFRFGNSKVFSAWKPENGLV